MQEINNAKQESSCQSILKLIRSKVTRGPPMLVVLCGPSHSGKSTFAEGLGGDFTVVSTDEVRRRLGVSFRHWRDEPKVWEAFEAMKRGALKSGQDVVLDACHLTPGARWHSVQGPNGRHTKICIVFELSWRTIRERCLKEKRVALPEVARMWKDFQKSRPTRKKLKSDGFDEAYSVNGQ
jgi:predicted kinase